MPGVSAAGRLSVRALIARPAIRRESGFTTAGWGRPSPVSAYRRLPGPVGAGPSTWIELSPLIPGDRPGPADQPAV